MPITDQELKAKADKVLQENFTSEPPVDIFEIAKNEGLIVETKDFGDKFNHISGYIKPEIRTIFVNSKDSESRRKFTVAHELGHWLFHREELENDPRKYAVLFRIPLGRPSKDHVEREANFFAANILVPEEMLNEKKDSNTPEQLAEIFSVSKELIGLRINDLSR